MKLLKVFCALSPIIFLSSCTDNLTGLNFIETSIIKGRIDSKKTLTINREISDKVKLKIIEILISSIKVNSKDICDEKQTIFFSTNSFSNYIVDNFPKKIGDCETILMNDGDEFEKDFKDQYHRFSHWKAEGDFVYVTFSTNFPGGNEGGCNYRFVKSKEKWFVKSSDCWATAS